MLYRANIGLVCVSSTSNCMKGFSSSLQYLTVLTWGLLDVHIYFLCCFIRIDTSFKPWEPSSISASSQVDLKVSAQFCQDAYIHLVLRAVKIFKGGMQRSSRPELVQVQFRFEFRMEVWYSCPATLSHFRSVITKINSWYRICKFQHTAIWS